jgi:aminoglycoside phosphotransferase (APT) family kinase protein
VTTDIDARALGLWLAERLPGASHVTVGEFGKPKSGFSAETLVFDAEIDSASGRRAQRLVLRREVPDPAVYPQQAPGYDVEVDIQYRCMAAISTHGKVPVAPLVGYEPDPAVLDAPFFVMGYVTGEVPTESPPYTESGFFVDASPAERRRLIENGMQTLATLHTLDWRAAGLEWLIPPGVTPGTAQQLAVWERYARRELDGRHHPLLEDALAWLHANLPADETVGFCWGDPRPGNIIWQDFAPVCLTDFEAASIASPLQDLGWWLMFDRTMHPDGSRLDGDLTRDEQRALYAQAAGIDVPDTAFHEVFAAARYAAIVVRVMNRMVARGHLPATQTIWLENPATAALRELMEDAT